MRKKLIVMLLCCPFLLNGSCTEKTSPDDKGDGKENVTPAEPGPEIALIAPTDGFSIALTENGEYTFEWEPLEGQNFYRLNLSRTQDFAEKSFLVVKNGKHTVKGSELNEALKAIGFGSAETAIVFWSIGPWDENLNYTPQVRRLKVTSLTEDGVSEPEIGTVKVKVAVVVEDPYYNGKRIHEIEHWNDPWKQMEEYAADWEEISHGAVDIEIVEVHDSPRMFCYTTSTANSTNREYMTPELLYERYLNPDPETGKAHIDIDGKTLTYDYVAMMDEFGLSAKVDAGTINEVWVYNHPACKMNESRFMGKGGFWCNSYPIEYGTGKDKAHNQKLVCVMFCNYERTVDLALHSFAHRTESIMSQLNYNNYWGFTNNTYSKYGVFTYIYDYWKKKGITGSQADLIPFDMFFSHGSAYDAIDEPGYAHIGTCHSPCNSDVDYGYEQRTGIFTFADEWDSYPYLHCNKDKARKVSCSEWEDPKGYQYGYMKWFYRHIPHFKGINTYDERDLHLNNWWHYLFDYYGALDREAELRAEIGK